MGVLYTREDIEAALIALRIRPTEDNLVTVSEAAKIFTWRAKSEWEIDRVYSTAAVRSHVDQGNLQVARQVNPRSNLFRVEDVFNVPLTPRRGTARKEVATEDAMLPLAYDGGSLHKTKHLVLESVS